MNRPNPSRIAVLGPGAIGGLLAGRLSQLGHDVTVIATERTAAAITGRGITLRTPDTPPFTTHPPARAWLAEPVDLLFVAVKATDLLPALQRIPAALVDGAAVIPWLNGTDHLPLLRAMYPDSDVIAATIAIEATRHEPGVIEQLSVMADVMVCTGTSERAAGIAELLSAAHLDVQTHDDEATVLWRKLSLLAPLALLTTAAAAPFGEAVEKLADWVRPLIEETAGAAASAGVAIDADAAEARLRGLNPTMQSSMLKDLLSGRPMEVDAIAGPIIRALGADSAPVTTAAVSQILRQG